MRINSNRFENNSKTRTLESSDKFFLKDLVILYYSFIIAYHAFEVSSIRIHSLRFFNLDPNIRVHDKVLLFGFRVLWNYSLQLLILIVIIRIWSIWIQFKENKFMTLRLMLSNIINVIIITYTYYIIQYNLSTNWVNKLLIHNEAILHAFDNIFHFRKRQTK